MYVHELDKNTFFFVLLESFKILIFGSAENFRCQNSEVSFANNHIFDTYIFHRRFLSTSNVFVGYFPAILWKILRYFGLEFMWDVKIKETNLRIEHFLLIAGKYL